MKIIAIAKENWSSKEWLVQLTEDEIAKIQGVSYASSLDKEKRPTIGAEFNVSAAWNDLQKFRSARDIIKNASDTLRGVASIAEAASACYLINPEPEKTPDAN